MTKETWLKRLIGEGKIGRRDFLMQAAAVGVGAAAAGSMFDAAQAATPKSGGHYKQGLTGGATSDTLDPAQILDSYMINVSFGQLRNNLTEIAPSGELIGELAESWDASADAATWTFKIRQGVEFHNGKTLDSTDVAESLRHHMGEDSKSAAKGIISNIEAVRISGSSTMMMSRCCRSLFEGEQRARAARARTI